MGELLVTREEVLAWMAAMAEGPTAAARHFGIPSGTVKCWAKRARERPSAVSRSKLSVLPPPVRAPPPKVAVPADLRSQAEQGVRLRMARLCDPELIAEESSRDLREGVKAILDALDVFPNLDAGKDKDDLATPEGREAALAELRALPESVRKKVMGS